MQSLDEKTWEPQTIQEVFTISPGKRLESRNRKPGKRPFIGALDNSNGVVQFVSDMNESFDCNVLGVNYNGNGMGIGFYHPYECVFSDDVKRFHLKNTEDCEELALFTKALIAKQRDKFGYLYKFNAKRMATTSIVLPVTDFGEPDYEYMRAYTQQKRKALLSKYRTYVEERITELGDPVEIPALDEKEWIPFHLEEVGNVTSGRDIYATERIDGNTPYVTSGGTNNGVGYFVGNENDTLDFGYIALNRNGAVGKAFYHPSKSLMGNDCRKVHLKEADNNLFVGQFIALCISMQSDCFSYSRKLGTARAKRMQIMLPTTDSGKPDYEYMEQYAKNMMLRKYKQYLTFLDYKKVSED